MTKKTHQFMGFPNLTLFSRVCDDEQCLDLRLSTSQYGKDLDFAVFRGLQ